MTRYSFILAAGLTATLAAPMASGQSTADTPPAQEVTRTELQRHDLGIAGREAIQMRIALAAGVTFPDHSHPGEEIIYVLEGSFEYRIAGRSVTVGAGEVLFIPAGTVHSARNIGRGNAVELATYIVEKGQPLVSTAIGAVGRSQAIRPFRVHMRGEDLADLRRRIRATRWSDQETVGDNSQGMRLGELQALMRYWGDGYDWRKAEAKLNAYPQFVTNIDGLDIHFIHVRSKHPNALPLIIAHGWPGSVFEQLDIIGPLTDPTAHGGRPEDAFDVIIPSMPGYGFSGKPAAPGWGLDRIARAYDVLMKRLGYGRYVAQGGDWGAAVAGAMARQSPPGLLGIHVNLPAAQPPEVAAAIASGSPPPPGLSDKEKAAFDALRTFFQKNRAYAVIMATKPQVIGAGLTDSPAGLAAFMFDYNNQEPLRLVDRDKLLDDVTLYWLTNSATSAARLYWEEGGRSVTNSTVQRTQEIALPVAVTIFPDEIYRAPESWVRRAYRNLVYFNEVDKGGHFAAWEEPELFARELRAAFKPLRYSDRSVAGDDR